MAVPFLSDNVILRLEVQGMSHTVLHHLRLHHGDIEKRVELAVESALKDDAFLVDLTEQVRQIVRKTLQEAVTRAIVYELPNDPRFKELVRSVVDNATKPR